MSEMENLENTENQEIGLGLTEEMDLEMAMDIPEESAELVEVSEETRTANLSNPALELVEEILPSELTTIETQSIVESVLFSSPHPMSVKTIAALFYGTNVDTDRVKNVLDLLQTEYAGGNRGITLEEVAGGFQLRTKMDNSPWIKRMVKARPFKLSGPALEVLSVVAYKQPVVKAEVDQIRGVESGHLVRALMEKDLIKFTGKSDLPGKPMLYGTSRKFLELFGLRNIRELPTLSEIDELIPEGIGENSDVTGLESETLGTLSDKIGLPSGKSYSDSENELLSITEELGTITTTTEFFEKEKIRERERKEAERAQDLRERKIVGETIPAEEDRWLTKFDARMAARIE